MAKKKRAVLYSILRIPVKLIMQVMFWPKSVATRNIPRKGGAIIACNHKNFFDPLILIHFVPRTVHFLSKKELHNGKFKSWFFKSLGNIPVNREKQDEKAKNAAIEVLENGKIIGIFPEGTRNLTKEMTTPFKFGAVSFAQKTGVPIIPAAISGKYKKFNPFNKIQIRYGEPIYVSKEMSLEEANNSLRKTIEKMLIEDGEVK